ncbi:MAG: thioesterase family protein [Xanthobacteraceae bacterium]|nr:thioesterase family protein [Xanthobacteraceae bacterium]
MTEFSALMDSMTQAADGWAITVSEDWLQGRTVYGGLGAALCLQAAQRQFGDLPPLRSAQISFIGPASGELKLTPVELRKGKSTVFVGVDLSGESGLATRVTFCFGAGRASKVALAAKAAAPADKPEAGPSFFDNAPPHLRFLRHIEGRNAGGALPFSGAKEPMMTLWLRHRDTSLKPSLVPLLALADGPPPAIAATLTTPGLISTMTWSIDLLTDTIDTTDGWWLIRTEADAAADGYTSQVMTVWNAAGQAVMTSRQNVAVFG